MQKANQKGTEFISLDDQQPEYTGKFDCEVLDGQPMIYPAQWVPPNKSTGYGNERGPGWRVLIPTEQGRSRVRFFNDRQIKKWRPTPRKRSEQGKQP